MVNEKNMPYAYAEVLAVIDALGEWYKKQLPEDVMKCMERKKDPNKTFHFNVTEEPPDLSHEALVLISLLNLKYWCKDEKEKQRLQKIYDENEIKYKLANYKKIMEKEANENSIDF